MFDRLPRALAALPVAVGLAAGASAATTSSSVEAATSITICIYWDGEEHCVEVPFAIDWSEVLCPGCPPDFQFRDDWTTNPALVATEVSQGLSDVLVAELSGDRRLRADGIAHFERASRLAGSRPAGVPSSIDWVTGLQQDVVDSLGLFGRAAATTDPAVASRLRTLAIGELDQAVDQLAGNVTAG
jgi:hypothetical protein